MEVIEVCAGEVCGAEGVVDEVDLYAAAGGVDEGGFESAACGVVADDVVLSDDGDLGAVDGVDGGEEGGFAVDEQVGAVGDGGGEADEFFECGEAFVAGGVGVAVGAAVFAESVGEAGGEDAEFAAASSACADVADESAAAEDEVEGDGEFGDEEEGDDPGEGSLGGARGHEGVGGEDEAQEAHEDEQDGEIAPGVHGGVIVCAVEVWREVKVEMRGRGGLTRTLAGRRWVWWRRFTSGVDVPYAGL